MAMDLNALANHALGRTTVEPAALAGHLATLGDRWSIDGQDLELELRGAKMARYGEVAARAAVVADELDHHPRIVLEYGHLVLTIHTHDTGSVTMTDVVYAARLESWLREQAIA